MPAQKYTQIYLDLKEKIEDGTYPEQGYLPSEYTLIEQYGCSRNTVRRAISQLADEAYVQSIHGKGVIVIYHQTPKNEFSLGGIESLKEAARRNNRSYKTKVIHFTEFVVDEYLHRKTGFAIGEEVIYVQRVRAVHGLQLPPSEGGLQGRRQVEPDGAGSREVEGALLHMAGGNAGRGRLECRVLVQP